MAERHTASSMVFFAFWIIKNDKAAGRNGGLLSFPTQKN
jgi:hypothetical protein